MSKIYAKIRERGTGNKYRVFLDIEETLYREKEGIVQETVLFDPATSLEEGVWYYIPDFSHKQFCLEILKEKVNSVDYNMLKHNEYDDISFIFEVKGDVFYFQSVGKSRLIRKKGLIRIGNEFRFADDYAAISINEIPDAMYDKREDKLYFRALSSITGIFSGISMLFREATDKETEEFLTQDFISVNPEFTFEKVKIPNRKRIALAMETLKNIKKKDRKKVLNYISEYCPQIERDQNAFKINNDEELTLLLYGIEERFYTTLIGNEKRIANSIIKMQ